MATAIVPDWQTDTNTSTAFNYLELKLFRYWRHIPPSHAGFTGRTQQRFAFNTNSLRCVCVYVSRFCSPLFIVIRFFWGGFRFLHSFRRKLSWFFFSPKWWNRWITRVVSWCLETSAETTKYSFKNGHHIKKQVEVEGFDALSRYMFWFDLCARVRFLFLALDLLNI